MQTIEHKIVKPEELISRYNPRQNMDYSDIEDSIKKDGIYEDLLVWNNNGDLEIIAGHRRWEVARKYKIKCPVKVLNNLTQEKADDLVYRDNLERENYSAVDDAIHYKHMIEKYKWTQEKCGETYNFVQHTISEKLSLLSLPKQIRDLIFIPMRIKRGVFFAENKALSWRSGCVIATLCRSSKIEAQIKEWYIDFYEKDEDGRIINKEFAHIVSNELNLRYDAQIKLAQNCLDHPDTNREQLQAQVKLMKNQLDESMEKRAEEHKKEQKLLDNIYFEDSRNMLEHIDKESVHLIVTSPPYFTSRNYEFYKGETGEEKYQDYLQLLYDVLDSCIEVLVSNGKLVINIADIAAWATHTETDVVKEKMTIPYIVDYLDKKGVYLYARIIWKKDDPWVNSQQVQKGFNTHHGDYRILPSWEYVFVFRKYLNKKYYDKRDYRSAQVEQASKISKNEWRDYVTGIWEIPSVRDNEDHPAQFPEKLVERIIRMYSFIGDNVLDPFLGSGTTVKVARKQGRVGIGFEINKDYRDVIIEKLQK